MIYIGLHVSRDGDSYYVRRNSWNVKDLEGDKHLAIINNEENNSLLLRYRNIRKKKTKKSKTLSKEKMMAHITLYMGTRRL